MMIWLQGWLTFGKMVEKVERKNSGAYDKEAGLFHTKWRRWQQGWLLWNLGELRWLFYISSVYAKITEDNESQHNGGWEKVWKIKVPSRIFAFLCSWDTKGSWQILRGKRRGFVVMIDAFAVIPALKPQTTSFVGVQELRESGCSLCTLTISKGWPTYMNFVDWLDTNLAGKGYNKMNGL